MVRRECDSDMPISFVAVARSSPLPPPNRTIGNCKTESPGVQSPKLTDTGKENRHVRGVGVTAVYEMAMYLYYSVLSTKHLDTYFVRKNIILHVKHLAEP